MPESAQVRSIEAIDAFRAHLVVFHTKARTLVDEVSAELRRTQLWLETDRMQHWQREVTRRTRALEAAQQALLSARIATFRDATPVEQNAVHQARRALEDATDHLRRLKRWIRDLGPRTESITRQIGGLDAVLSQDIPRAIAWLTRVVRLLEDYSRSGVLPPLPPLPDPAEPTPATPGDPTPPPAQPTPP